MASPSVQLLPPSTDMAKRKAPTNTYGSANSAKRSAASISTASHDSRIRFLKLHYSDGTEVWQDGVNGPTPDMLDMTPDDNGAQTYMRPVARYEKKELEWLRILAEGIVASCTDQAVINDIKDGKKYFFDKLPDGYRLYEQVRVPGNGGGKARRDTYLYGHPKGPRKRFRSPGDFLIHVKWLSTDTTKNPANCGCHACKGGPATAGSPPATPASAFATAPAVPISPGPSAPPAVPAAARTQVPMTHRSAPPAAPNNANTGVPRALSTPSVGSFPPPPHTQPVVSESILLSSATHREREHDLQFPGLSIYRLGEQVWFQTGPHWAIGVVIEVPAVSTSNYKIHPLQSPLICEQTPAHNDIPSVQLRPWVAWSTPPVTNRNLDTDNTVAYENLPWQQESRSGSLEVDASILKSRDVDISYTLIEKLTNQNHYSGIYYGAERFWIGDAVRIKTSTNPNLSTGREIMVVSSIQDLAPAPVGVRSRDSRVTITGDIFRLTNHPHSVPPPPGLPSAVLGDLQARARFSTSDPAAPYWTYTSISTNITVKLEDIKGRWYPGSSLFRIVHGLEKFKKLAETANINSEEWDSTGSRMNEMGTGGGGATLGWRRYEHRHQAFNKAIPSQLLFTPLLVQGNVPDTIEKNMQTLGLHQSTEPTPANINAHTAHTVSEPIDLTGDDNEGMEFLADQDSVDEEFMKRMGEDAASFLADEGDFYGGL